MSSPFVARYYHIYIPKSFHPLLVLQAYFFAPRISLPHCTFFNTLPFFFLTLFSLLVLIQTLGQPTLRGHQRRAGRQRSNRDLISWRKPSPRKDSRRLFAMVISDMSQFPPIRHSLGFSRVSIVWSSLIRLRHHRQESFPLHADWRYIVIVIITFQLRSEAREETQRSMSARKPIKE